MDGKNAGDEGAALLRDFATHGDGYVESDFLRGGSYPATVAELPGNGNGNGNGHGNRTGNGNGNGNGNGHGNRTGNGNGNGHGNDFVDLDNIGDIQFPLCIYSKDDDIPLRLLCIFACQMAELYHKLGNLDAFKTKLKDEKWVKRKNKLMKMEMINRLLSTFDEGCLHPDFIADFKDIPITVLPYLKEFMLLRYVTVDSANRDKLTGANDIRKLFNIACDREFNSEVSELSCEPPLIIAGFDLYEVNKDQITELVESVSVSDPTLIIKNLCAIIRESQYNEFVKPILTEAFMQYSGRDGGYLSTKEYYDKFCNFMASTIFLIFGSMSLKFILDIPGVKNNKAAIGVLSLLLGLPSAFANRAIAKQVLYGLLFTRKAEQVIGEANKLRNINANVNGNDNSCSCENILYTLVSRSIYFYRNLIGLLSAMIVSISYWSSTLDGFNDVSTSLGFGVIPEGWNYCLPTAAFSFRCFFMVEALGRQKLEYKISPCGEKLVKMLSQCFKNIDNEKDYIPDWLSLFIKQFFYKKIKQERMSLKSAVKWDLYFFCYNIACVYYVSYLDALSYVARPLGLDINATDFIKFNYADLDQSTDRKFWLYGNGYNYYSTISLVVAYFYGLACLKLIPSFRAWLPNDCFKSSGAASVAERGVLGRAISSSKLISVLAMAAGQGAAISASQKADNFAFWDWRKTMNNVFGVSAAVKPITIVLNFYIVYALNLVPLMNQIAGLVFDMILNEENTRAHKLQRIFTRKLVGKGGLDKLANPGNLSFNAALKSFRNTAVGRFLKYDETCYFNPRSSQYTTSEETHIKQGFCDVINAINAMNGLYRITHPFNRLLLEGLIDKYEKQVKLLCKEFETDRGNIDQETMTALEEIYNALFSAKRAVGSFMSGSEITAKRLEFDRVRESFKNNTYSDVASCVDRQDGISPDLSDNEGAANSRGTNATPPPYPGRVIRLPASPFYSSSPDTPNRRLGSNSFGDSGVKPSALRARTVSLDPLDPKATLDQIEGGKLITIERKAGAFLSIDGRLGNVPSCGATSPVPRQRRPTLQAQVKTGDDENQLLRLDGSGSPYSVVSGRGSVNSPVSDGNFSPRSI